jgi:predicted acetyltransferase
MQNNTNNYNNHHGDYFLINTENAKYTWCAVKRHKSYWSTVTVQALSIHVIVNLYSYMQGLK